MVQLRDSAPYFNQEFYETECDNCGSRTLFHYGVIGQPPVNDATKVHFLYKCLNRECGQTKNYEPPLNEEEEDHLRSNWGGDTYYPWSHEHQEDHEGEIERVYTADEAEEIKQNLKDLGYF